MYRIKGNHIALMLFLLPVVIAISCANGGNGNKKAMKPSRTDMSELNKYMVEKDRDRIQNYIERKGLKMTESSFGLWYYIENEGEGNLLDNFDNILIDYDCSLLDGSFCYSSDKTGPKNIVLGKTNIEAGLDMGLRMLKPGGKAVFIIPPFLAYGLKGDGNRIPSRSILVYKVKVLR